MGSAVSSHARDADDDTDVFYDCIEIMDDTDDDGEVEFNSGSAARDDGDEEGEGNEGARDGSADRENGAANSKRAHAGVDRLSPKFTPQKRRRREGEGGGGGGGPAKPSPHKFVMRWDRHLAALRSYAEEHGGRVDVPPNYTTEDGLKIGKW